MHSNFSQPTGTFISFEGIDGAGKSTHIATIAESLREQGLTAVMTREPGGTPLAEKLRSVILNDPMDGLTEALLAFAARRDHLNNVIIPAITSGHVVLCDRFTDSTIAYQGFGRQLPQASKILGDLEHWVQFDDKQQKLIQPELTLWFDLDPSVAAARLRGSRAPDRFELQTTAFFARVRSGYLSRMQADPDRIIRIEADQPSDQVCHEVMEVVQSHFSQKAGSVARPHYA